MTNVVLPPLVIATATVVATLLAAKTGIAVTMPRAAVTGVAADTAMASPAVAITVMNLLADDMDDITLAKATDGITGSPGDTAATAATASELTDITATVDAMLVTVPITLVDAGTVSHAVTDTTESTNTRDSTVVATGILTAITMTVVMIRVGNVFG